MSELEPCPFCGGIADTIIIDSGSAYDDYCRVECRDCGAKSGTYWSIQSAIEAWNTREERTCTMEYVQEYSGDEFYPTIAFGCQECGYVVIDGIPKYCPSCGSKVV